MCGIAGIFTRTPRPELTHPLRAMAKAMRHRGPDDEGFALFPDQSPPILAGGADTPSEVWSSNLPYAPDRKAADISARFGMAHRRLAIVDLSATGHQPMCSASGRYWISFNGEIYNANELRMELKDDRPFYGTSDTEILLRAYERWDNQCFQRFNGMWAIAIWDTEEQTLLLSRDRLGIKPLYYHRSGDHFLFASDIKTLIASQMFEPQPNWENVYHAFSFRCAPRPRTCFQDVQAVEQGTIMRLDRDGNATSERYWDIPSNIIDQRPNETEWVERLEALLDNSVRRRLIADAPVGAFMSGGIDSTVVSGLASRHQPGFTAFTLGFEAAVPEMDETPQAREAAAMHAMTHIVQIVDPDQAITSIPDMIRCYEEPFYTLSPNYIISRLAAENGMKVVLNGLGGDELFCGYGRERIMNEWQAARTPMARLSRLFTPRTQHKRQRELAALKDETDVFVRAFAIFPEKWKDRLFAAATRKWQDSASMFRDQWGLGQRSFSDSMDALFFLELIGYMGNHHLHRVDQFTMRFSLEGRFPFLDHELVEMAATMPSRFKVNQGLGKYALRQFARNHIPSTCLNMKKKGFGLPVEHWMRHQLRPLVDDAVTRLKKRHVLTSHEIDRTVAEFDQGRAHYRLWLLVSLELWLQEFFEGGITPQKGLFND